MQALCAGAPGVFQPALFGRHLCKRQRNVSVLCVSVRHLVRQLAGECVEHAIERIGELAS